MMLYERAAGRQHDRKHRHRFRLLIGTACATWIDLAQAHPADRPIDESPPPLLLCTAELLIAMEPFPLRARRGEAEPADPGVRPMDRLSFAAAPSNKDSESPAAGAPALAAAARIEEPEQPLPFEAVRPGPSNTVSNEAAPRPDNLPDLTTVSWTVAPIRWGGNVGSNFYWNDSPGAGRTYSQTPIFNLRGSSYIYQPWYAQVSGDIGLLSNGTKQSGGNSGTGGSSNSTAVTYGGNLSLFPQSRFPFQAYVQSSNGRADSNTEGSRFSSLRMGASQNYRPETGPEVYTGSVDRSIVNNGDVRSVVDALQGTFATTIGDHALSANARYSSTSGDVGGQSSDLLSLYGTHNWHSDEDITVASTAYYSNNQIHLLTGPGLSLNNSELMQVVSSATWLPKEDVPLTIIGGGNFLRLNTQTDSGNANITNLNGYANAIYRYSRNLTATAGLTLSEAEFEGISAFSSAQNASVAYAGDPRIFGEYTYNWGVGGGFSNQTISGGADNRNTTAQIQHSLVRNIGVNETNAVTLDFSQSLAHVNNSTTGQSDIFTNTAGALWRMAVGERTLGMLGVTLSDSIANGDFSGHLRNLTAQGSLQTRLNARATLSANLNAIVSQQLGTLEITQSAPNSPANSTLSVNNGGSTLNGSAQVSYAHRNPFGIANLFYTATFQANTSQTNLRLISGDPNALGWQTNRELRQDADYRIGRLMFRATSSFARINGRESVSVFFMINREFGNF